MKKFITLFLALSLLATSFAGTNIVEPKKPAKINANNVLIPVGKNGEKISLMDLSRMKVKDLEAITGNKMKLTDKVGFALAQKQLRSSIDADGTINNRKLNKVAAKADDGSGFHLGGFALGFLLGLIGVLVAYLIKDDKKSARVKWAWIGLAAWVVIWLIFFIL
jgi:hypothetical protein